MGDDERSEFGLRGDEGRPSNVGDDQRVVVIAIFTVEHPRPVSMKRMKRPKAATNGLIDATLRHVIAIHH